ncbi:MAG TPA: formate/nitrite transporter family protein, partial [Spirochaetota bacterium]|nr:formate/nitrite transporter family protein [Spirochaetota bacterium]
TWSGFFVNNLIPVTLGNIVGGAIFVGFAYFLVFKKNCKAVEC